MFLVCFWVQFLDRCLCLTFLRDFHIFQCLSPSCFSLPNQNCVITLYARTIKKFVCGSRYTLYIHIPSLELLSKSSDLISHITNCCSINYKRAPHYHTAPFMSYSSLFSSFHLQSPWVQTTNTFTFVTFLSVSFRTIGKDFALLISLCICSSSQNECGIHASFIAALALP